MTVSALSCAHMRGLALCAALCACLLAGPVSAREAGWVPLEQSSGLAKQKLPATSPQRAAPRRAAPKKAAQADIQPLRPGASVYDGQPPVNEAELYEFLELLPKFRSWARSRGEEAHPMVGSHGKPDFLYSPAAAGWVAANGFAPARFFCVMGRMAAALAIVEEGNDAAGSRPADMPAVDAKELALARKHLGELLSAGGPPGQIR